MLLTFVTKLFRLRLRTTPVNSVYEHVNNMKKIAFLLIMSGLAGCKDDAPHMEATVLKQLTTGSSKSWKIESATLNNGTTGELSVTSLANVNDDEFVFTADPLAANVAQLDWRIRNQVRSGATTTKEALLDYYLSGLARKLAIQSDGSIVSDDPKLQIEMAPNGQLAVRYQIGSSELRLNLVPTGESTLGRPTLDFEFLTDIESSTSGLEQAAGFTGSMASNSLYISYKAFVGTNPNPERVVRYDINDGTFTTRDFLNNDFVTKELHIINDELKVVGAQFVNTYPLDLGNDPVSVPHNLMISRYGSTVVDDNVFIFGGDLLFPTTSPPVMTGPGADKIYRHDQATGQLHEVGALPEPRYWSHGEIVDGKLYVFGGRQAFITDVGEDDIFVHDMASGDNQTLKLPSPMHRTFASRYGHLIYVAGQRHIPNADPALATIETAFGVFDTHTGTYKVMPTTLGFAGKTTVYGMTIVGDVLYILYGTVGVTTFSIYRAPLTAN